MLTILAKMGYKATLANDGLEVLSALETQVYDIVLMDLQMPNLGGVDATKEIRERYPKAQQPNIIALTASTTSMVQDRCNEVGIDEILTKPFQIKELERLFKETYERKEQIIRQA